MNVASLPPASAEPVPTCSAFVTWVTNLRYFTFSALLHLLLVLLLGGTVLYQKYVEPPDFVSEPGGLVGNEAPSAPPPTDQAAIQPTDFAPTAPNVSTQTSATASQIAAITTSSAAPSAFSMSPVVAPNLAIKTDTPAAPIKSNAPSISTGLSREAATRIAGFSSGWAKGGRGSFGKPLKSRAFEFTAYLAKYQGGDWDSTTWMEGKEMRGGSLHNLLFIISKLSKSKIHADAQPVPLDLSSNEIFEKKPPFIFFTGHRDFKLTDQEVKNLGEYLRSGGCIWGDSSLPGQRSRFDIAFRREMLRLLPELNQKWHEIPTNHAIFTGAYYTEIRGVVPGMNFYDEPIYALNGLANEIAVLYTANDYGDMWQFGLDEKGEFDLSRDEKRRMVATNEEMWYRRNLYYRNVEPGVLSNTYKFGTNIIVYLLTRWEDKIRMVPGVKM